MITAGIDVGSRRVKALLLDADDCTVVGHDSVDQGLNQGAIAEQLLAELTARHGLEMTDLGAVVATGYGRNSVPSATRRITEISCHARGVRQLLPDALTIIEIGGQDSKVIWLDRRGVVQDFMMNDRCAAGTGCFLERIAAQLNVSVFELGQTASGSTAPAMINNTCAVFAETEILGLLATGTACEDIAAGVQNAVASRINTMAGHAAVQPVAFTGGVARIPGMAAAIEASLGIPVIIPPDCDYTGALGAAILAAQD